MAAINYVMLRYSFWTNLWNFCPSWLGLFIKSL